MTTHTTGYPLTVFVTEDEERLVINDAAELHAAINRALGRGELSLANRLIDLQAVLAA